MSENNYRRGILDARPCLRYVCWKRNLGYFEYRENFNFFVIKNVETTVTIRCPHVVRKVSSISRIGVFTGTMSNNGPRIGIDLLVMGKNIYTMV